VRAETGLARVALMGLVAAAVAGGRARGAEVAAPPGAPGDRAVSTLAVREAVLDNQAEAARAEVRWRLGALYRLAVAGQTLPAAARARALDAGARVLSRALAEARSLEGERDQLRAQRATLAAVARRGSALRLCSRCPSPVRSWRASASRPIGTRASSCRAPAFASRPDGWLP
jgi:hypothetical protein